MKKTGDPSMRKESGFTLIELVVVIVILGILAAFAVPRFVGMQDEARTSTVKGLKGSLHGAAALAHGKLLANQTEPVSSSNYNMTIQGQDVEFAADTTWPSASMDGIGSMVQDLSGFSNSTSCDNLTGVSNCIKFYPQGAASANCYVEYGITSDGYPKYANKTSDCS